MRHLFVIMTIALFLFYPSHGFTAVKEIISEGAYNMGDGETPSVAESRALLNAKRIALEQAGTYVESYTKVENIQVTKDEIQVLTSGIMEVEILDKKRTIVGEGFRFWVKIKARVNPDRIQEMANKIQVRDRSFVDDYKKIQEAYEKSQKEIEGLKKQLAQAKDKKEKKKVEAKITDDERLFQTNEWLAKGYQHTLNKEYDKAIEAYNKAIAINPNLAEAYTHRALAYTNKGQYDRAIEDCNKAIAINPNDFKAYNNRGLAYDMQRQSDMAIEDYNKAIALAIAINPNFDISNVYFLRGGVYNSKGQYDRAIEDFQKAIALAPNNAIAYHNRGVAYQDKGDMGMAISDYQKACDMGYENGCKNLKIVLQKR
jgi:tetratricopeptide (TPR) repeat protein